ncbi:MAG: hypothetical protein KJ905_02490 [Nanoarchaeota archaeon]|nr:hypothetical protein [Nanoarchaeota archaeon]MBU1501619.1 hypothetical protein [Nanoarchaeota archaeon]
MKKQLTFVVLGLFLIGLASAIPSPHAFNGNVYYSDGTSLLQENLEVTAELGDFEVSSMVTNGGYDLIVESDAGGTIYFFITKENGVYEEIRNYTFKSFEITELDLVTSIIKPVPPVAPPANNPPTSSPSSSGGSSGSSGSSTTTIDNTIQLNGEESSNSDGSNGENINLSLNEEEILGRKNPGITGAAIGFIKSGTGMGLIFTLLVLGAGAVIIKKRMLISVKK